MDIFRHISAQAVVALAAALAMLALIVPLPGWALDLLLSANLAISLAVFALVLLVRRPVRLSGLPGLIVVSSLGRVVLALAVARNILLGGTGGDVVSALGVIGGGGGWLVGIVVVLMVALIDLLVIAVGMVRVSEVLARFALDALPGRQMGVDAAVADGRLSAQEASDKQQQIDDECAFYGAMDGAARFLRGDCITTLIIVAATPLVALLTSRSAAATTGGDLAGYLQLATGHGLVILLPALLIGGAGAIVLARAGSEKTFGSEIAGELLVQPMALGAAAVVLLVIALISPTARLPLIVIVLVIAGVAVAFRRQSGGPVELDVSGQQRQDSNRIEIGLGLIHIVQHEELETMLAEVRQRVQRRIGLSVKPFVATDSSELGMNQVALVINGQLTGQCTVRPGRLLAVGASAEDFAGADEARCGARNVGAWIAPDDEETARRDGVEVVEPLDALLMLVADRLLASADELFDARRAAEMLGEMATTHPELVEAAEAQGLDAAVLRRIGTALLADGVSLQNSTGILEGAVEALRDGSDEEGVIEAVRKRLTRNICQAAGPDGTILAIELAPAVAEELAAGYANGQLGIPPQRAEEWLRVLSEYSRETFRRKHPIVVLCDAQLRPALSKLIAESGQSLMAIAFDELVPDYSVQRLGVITEAEISGQQQVAERAGE